MAGPRDSKHYSETQLQAILTANLIDGITGADVVRLAAKGKLGGLPAFRVDRTYVYQLIRNNRDAFENENPEALARSTNKALALAHKANLKALEALAPETDPQERARIAKAVADTAKTLGSAKVRRPLADTNTQPTEPTTDVNMPNVVADLLRHAPKTSGQGARTGSLTDARSAASRPE